MTPLHREGGQLQRRHPAFGPFRQRQHVALRQRRPGRALEVRRRLVVREAQVGGADLDEAAIDAQPSERQRWVRPGGDHEADPFRQPIENESNALVNLRRFDGVVVVKDEHDVVGEAGEVVEQGGDDRVERCLRRLEKRDGGSAERLAHGGRERSDHVGPERDRVVVAVVEREPCPVWPILGKRVQPLREHGGLAEPRRRGDECERRCRIGGYPVTQPPPSDGLGRPSGDVELRVEQRTHRWRAHALARSRASRMKSRPISNSWP